MMAKKAATEFLVMCDGLRVGRAPTEAKAKALVKEFDKQYPNGMVFTVEPAKSTKKPHITKS